MTRWKLSREFQIAAARLMAGRWLSRKLHRELQCSRPVTWKSCASKYSTLDISLNKIIALKKIVNFVRNPVKHCVWAELSARPSALSPDHRRTVLSPLSRGARARRTGKTAPSRHSSHPESLSSSRCLSSSSWRCRLRSSSGSRCCFCGSPGPSRPSARLSRSRIAFAATSWSISSAPCSRPAIREAFLDFVLVKLLRLPPCDGAQRRHPGTERDAALPRGLRRAPFRCDGVAGLCTPGHPCSWITSVVHVLRGGPWVLQPIRNFGLSPSDPVRAKPPTAWFLPGPQRMRGGAARRFASDRHFHRGSQAEATCPVTSGKATRYQRVAESRSWRAGFFAESREASLRKPPRRKPASGSHLQGSH